MRRTSLAFILACSLPFLSGCASLGFPTLEQQLQTSDQRVMTEAQAADIVNQIFKDKKLTYQDTKQDARLTGILDRLGRAAGSGVPFKARLYQDTEANAFAIGGKYVFVSSGIVNLFPNDDNLLAGVIGHEIAHDLAGHHQRQQTEAMWRSAVTKAATDLGKKHAGIVDPLAQVTSTLVGLGFSRGEEKEADTLGTVYAFRAGYDPSGLIKFFEKTGNASNSSKLANFLSTHPYHPARVSNIQLVNRYLKEEITLEQVRLIDKQTASVLQSLSKVNPAITTPVKPSL